tara:strand:- start:1798 stop:2709 length:912 start_codon:yes stop_codon:yes gene_type:complete
MRFILAVILILQGCASVPKWSNNPEDCEPYIDDYVVDVLTMAKSTPRTFKRVMPFICVDQPESIKLPSFINLIKLPPAEQMPVVAVYKFQDLTGQRKNREGIADFSTAVTQGGTELIIDALKTAGNGGWFRVVDRQGLDNLVRERQIIRSARQDFAKANGGKAQELGALLFAGMIIDGGIIGYDANIITGGRGARYLGIGMTRQYRKDVVTVSVRATSVLTGEIILNVQARKTILSYGAGGDVFKFIEEGTELVEYEDGVGKNESVTYATRAAIEAAVLELIYQGQDRGLWKIQNEEIKEDEK